MLKQFENALNQAVRSTDSAYNGTSIESLREAKFGLRKRLSIACALSSWSKPAPWASLGGMKKGTK